jgi:starch-binding outer membrane protein, SusD/RagB family
MNILKIIGLVFLLYISAGCSKLENTFTSELEQNDASNIPVAEVLKSAYNSLNNVFMDQSRFWAAQQHTSDETIGPTRGPDWDDNGVWRVLHSHEWNADHGFLRDTYRELLQGQFAASNVLRFSPNAQQAGEARFLRALTMFSVLDGWDQVPYREDLVDFKLAPTTLKGTEAADFIIAELNAILNDLPATGPAYVANRDAARALLMKVYLNKGVFANRAAPTFAAADMNQVIALADAIIASGRYQLDDNFYDNFAWDNDVKSSENIFTLYNKDGERGGNVRSRWFLGLHYNQNPSGWNGFTTLSDFYDKFGTTDMRREASYTGVTNVTGMKVGFLVGLQRDQNGVALQDRKGNPLAFTREVKLKETGNDLEITGIRVMKYPPDLDPRDQADNDYVILRYADVLLMKAEAILRGGTATGAAPFNTALGIVNAIRAIRMATPLAAVDLPVLLDERGRELYWEGWRRQDLIRFGRFLQPWQEKPASDPRYLIFAIPSEQLAVNPNLTQNPGY